MVGSDVFENMPRHRRIGLVPGMDANDQPTVFHLFHQSPSHFSGQSELIELFFPITHIHAVPKQSTEQTGRRDRHPGGDRNAVEIRQPATNRIWRTSLWEDGGNLIRTNSRA